MRKDVKARITTCDMCQRAKHLTVAMEGEYEFVSASKPGELVTSYNYGPLPPARAGMQYILVMTAVFSKYTCIYPTKRVTTLATLNCIFNKFIPKWAKPNKILSDHGTMFTSPKWKTKLEDRGIMVLYSSSRHPESNPIERVMRELGRMFRTVCATQHTAWINRLSEIEKVLNITVHCSTGYIPQELHFGIRENDEIMRIIKYPPQKELAHQTIIVKARENLKKV